MPKANKKKTPAPKKGRAAKKQNQQEESFLRSPVPTQHNDQVQVSSTSSPVGAPADMDIVTETMSGILSALKRVEDVNSSLVSVQNGQVRKRRQ